MIPRWFVCLLPFFAVGATGCRFIQNQCVYGSDGGDGVLRCVVGGDSVPGEPRLDRILAQDFRYDDDYSCQSLYTKTVKVELYLLACREQAESVVFTNQNTKVFNRDRERKLGGGYPMPTGTPQTCENYTTFTIATPLMNTNEARGFRNGIRIIGWNYDSSGINQKPHIIRGAGTFHSGGSTCNVVKNGMPGLELKNLWLDNAPCVQDEAASYIEEALTRFGPDQLEIARFTKLWPEYDPLHCRIENVVLHTWYEYRDRYPGRSLIACDALNSKKYPPDPIRLSEGGIDNMESTAFIIDGITDALVSSSSLSLCPFSHLAFSRFTGTAQTLPIPQTKSTSVILPSTRHAKKDAFLAICKSTALTKLEPRCTLRLLILFSGTLKVLFYSAKTGQ